MKILFPLFMLISVSAFGQYTIPKDYFINQFSDTTKLSRIYCINKKGEKIWLTNIISFYLTLELKDSGLKNIVLTSASYKNGIIDGMELNETLFKKDKRVSVNLSDVSLIIMFAPYSVASPYFDFDSSVKIWNKKNDSLTNYYSSGTQFVLYLVAKTKSKTDSILLFENACYNIIFKDGTITSSGVILKISPDSIYMTTSFNSNAAAFDKLDYKILKYAVSDIEALKLLKGGGFSYKKINVSDYDMVITKTENNTLMRPTFFKINPRTGEVDLYRRLLTLNGFAAIKEMNGKTYWYERNL